MRIVEGFGMTTIVLSLKDFKKIKKGLVVSDNVGNRTVSISREAPNEDLDIGLSSHNRETY